ncbi:MAG: NPCBM/NEW2 domain-containing protein [Myxococcota bacterium]
MRLKLDWRASRWALCSCLLASTAFGCSSDKTSNAGGSGGGGGLGQGGGSGVGGSGSKLVAVPNSSDEFPTPKTDGLAPKPPMGWNSWNSYSTRVTADLIMRTADLIVSSGMKDAGYSYVNIDDGWMLKKRVPVDPAVPDGPSTLEPDPAHFPPAADGRNGIQVVADYVHSLGLKLGIYSDRGTATCGGFAASGGHEVEDAAAFAAWGVDYLKYDSCNASSDPAVREAEYKAMSAALAAVRHVRPIVFSLCSWQFDEWNAEAGELWRTTGDIAASFSSRSGIPSTSYPVVFNASANTAFAAYQQPNAWNDPDMLEVGNLGVSALANEESKSHFNLWAMMSAPLIAGNKLDGMSEITRTILTNREVIAIDQDELGIQGVPVRSTESTSVWAKPLKKVGARAVLLFNADTVAQNVNVTLADIGLSPGKATIRDLWDPNDTGKPFSEPHSVMLPGHGSMMYVIEGDEPGLPQGTAYLSDVPWIYAANSLGPVERDRNIGGRAAGDGGPLVLRGKTYSKGLGVMGGSKVIYRLANKCSRFTATVGVDDDANGAGSVQFQVWADGEKLYPSGAPETVTGADATHDIDVDVSGKYRLTLLVTSARDGALNDRADWADAKITCSP